MLPMGPYDFIVVGAGTAGCVIAARLSADPVTRVLLLEAGKGTPPSGSTTPDLWIGHIGSEASCVDVSTFQAATGATTPLVHGRGIGGSSAINGMIFAQGHRTGYDRWHESGAVGWGFNDLLPVGPTIPLYEVMAACLSVAIETGFDRATDISGGLEVGFGPADANIVDGARQSAADAYLTPALQRAHLDFVPDATVECLRIADGRCTVVEYRTGGRGMPTFTAAAAEVVLAAGAIGSPQLLMLSGIGPRAKLREVGIDVIRDLPGVGANLHDHLLVPVAYRASDPIPKATSNHGEVLGLIQTELADSTPDLQVVMTDSGLGILPELSGAEAGYGMLAAGEGVDDDEALRANVKNNYQTCFHLVGTCAMGSTEISVVDSELRVHGVNGLRVAELIGRG